MQPDPIRKHSSAQTIILHIFPGVLVGGFYFLARQPIAGLGYPSVFAQMLAFALVRNHKNGVIMPGAVLHTWLYINSRHGFREPIYCSTRQ